MDRTLTANRNDSSVYVRSPEEQLLGALDTHAKEPREVTGVCINLPGQAFHDANVHQVVTLCPLSAYNFYQFHPETERKRNVERSSGHASDLQ